MNFEIIFSLMAFQERHKFNDEEIEIIKTTVVRLTEKINKLPKDEVERLRKRLPEVISQIGMAEPGAKKEAGKIYLD